MREKSTIPVLWRYWDKHRDGSNLLPYFPPRACGSSRANSWTTEESAPEPDFYRPKFCLKKQQPVTDWSTLGMLKCGCHTTAAAMEEKPLGKA